MAAGLMLQMECPAAVPEHFPVKHTPRGHTCPSPSPSECPRATLHVDGFTTRAERNGGHPHAGGRGVLVSSQRPPREADQRALK